VSFITDGSDALPAVKSDLRVPTGAVTEWAADDANALRQALLDTRSEIINIIQAGTGAGSTTPVTANGTVTARTLGERFADVVNVKDYGAVGNGVTDDYAAIQAAINAVYAAGGGTIYFPAGTYALASPVLLKSYVRLQGAGKSYTIFQQIGTAASWYSKMDATTPGIFYSSKSVDNDRIEIADCIVNGIHTTPVLDTEGGGSGPFAACGIWLQRTQRSTVSRVKVKDTSSGFVASGTISGLLSHHILFEDCEAYNTASWNNSTYNDRPRGFLVACNGTKMVRCRAFDAPTGVYASGERIQIDQCWVEGNAAYGADNAYYLQLSYGSVTNSYALDFAGNGFAIAYNQYGTLVQGCTAKDCTNQGFRIHAPQSFTRIIGNHAFNCGYGFSLEATSMTWPGDKCLGLSIIGNTAQDSDYSGFSLQWMEDSVISGNVAENNNLGSRAGQGGYAIVEHFRYNRFTDNTANETVYGLKVGTSDVVGNRFIHTSKAGTDIYYPVSLNGEFDAVIAIGTRAKTGTVTFAQEFEAAPRVIATIQDGTALADSERPASVCAYSVSTTGFSYVVDCHNTTAAERTITIAWEATAP
jgi:parallel beta-helix repeat protein